VGNDRKIYETYKQRDDEQLFKDLEEIATPSKTPTGPKPQAAPAPKDESKGLVGAIRDFGMGIASLPEKAADVIYPKTPPTPQTIQPGQTDLSFGQTVQNLGREVVEKVAERSAEGVGQVNTAMAGKSKPTEFGVKSDVFGQAPETPEQVAAAQPGYMNEKLGFMRDLLSGSFGVAMPFGAAAGHALGEVYDYKNKYSGAMTDEVLGVQLRYAREKYGENSFQAQLVKDLLAKPYEQRLADGRQMAEMVGEALSGLVPGYSTAAGLLKGAERAAAKSGRQVATEAARAGVGREAEAGARAVTETPEQAAAKAEWATRMKPKALPPAPPEVEAAAKAHPMPPSSTERPPIMSANPAKPLETAKDIGEGAVSPLEQGRAALQTPDVQQWADGIMAKVKELQAANEADLAPALEESVRKQSKLYDAQGRKIAGGGEPELHPHQVANLVSRMALGAVLGAAMGEDPETAAMGALAGAVAPKTLRAIKAAYPDTARMIAAFKGGAESVRAERTLAETTASIAKLDTSTMAAKSLEGGMSWNPHTNTAAPYEGYFVGVHPERGEFTMNLRPDAVAEELKRFAEKNADLLAKDPDLLIGTERVTVNGEERINIDLSRNTPDKAEAMRLGQQHEQQRIWDAANNMAHDVPPAEPGREMPPISGTLPEAKVSPKGFQPGYADQPGFELFNLDEAIPGHPKGSTVSAESIKKAGYRMPADIENALAPTGEATSAKAAMGESRAMTEEAGRDALRQMRANDAILEELKALRANGEFPREYIETLYEMFKRTISGGSDAPIKKIRAKLPNTVEALRLASKGEGGLSWYQGVVEELQKHFGKDWEIVANLLAVMSPIIKTEDSVTMAVKAFADFKAGVDPAVIAKGLGTPSNFAKNATEGILNGKSIDQVLKSRQKVWNYAKALKGDRKAVVVDRWMWRVFYPEEVARQEAKREAHAALIAERKAAGASKKELEQLKDAMPGEYSGTQARYQLISDWMTQQAAKMGIEPADLQAAIWVAKKIEAGDVQGIKPMREMIAEAVKAGGLTAEKEAFDFFDSIKSLTRELPPISGGSDAPLGATKISEKTAGDLGTTMMLARAVIGGVLGASTGEDLPSAFRNGLIAAGLGTVASTKVLRNMKAKLVEDAMRPGLEQLSEGLKATREMPPIGGGSDPFVPRSVFGDYAKTTVPPKDLKAAHMDLDQKLDYARRLGAAAHGEDDLIRDAVTQSRFKSVSDVFKLDVSTIQSADIPAVVKDLKAMNAFVLEDLSQTVARAKLLGTPEAAEAVMKRYAYAGRYSQRVSDMEKSLGRNAMHADVMQPIIDMDTLAKEISAYEGALGSQLKDPSQLIEMISRTQKREAIKALAEQSTRFPAALWNIYYGINLLSSPITHVKNMVGNLGALGVSIADRAVAEYLIHPFSVVLGVGDRGVKLGETKEFVKGMYDMIADSFRAGKKGAFGYMGDTILTGESRFGRETKASERLNLQAARDLGQGSETNFFMKLIDTVSTLGQYNLRFMDGTDEFFKMLTFGGELRAQALREVKRMGLKGADFRQEFRRLMDSPSTDMLREAHAMAHENTFTKAFERTKDWQHLGGMGFQAGELAGNDYVRLLATPFYRTPMRVAEFSTVHTPGLNLLAVQTYSDLAKGGAKAELALSKMLVGLGAAGMLFYVASDGYITGDWPKDPRYAASLQRKGWQPRSIYNPASGKYTSYAGMEPLSAMLAGAANFAIAAPHLRDDTIQTLWTATMLTYGSSVTDNPFMQGASDLGDIVSHLEKQDDTSALLKIAQQRMLSMMPGAALGRTIQNAAGQGTKQTEYKSVSPSDKINPQTGLEDSGQRELSTLWGKVMQQVPGYGWAYGKGLSPKTNYITNEPIPNETGWWGVVAPWAITTSKNDRVLNTIADLGGCRLPKELIRVLGGNMPSDSAIVKEGDPREGVLLTDEERAQFGKLLATLENSEGQNLYQALDALIQSEKFADANDTKGKDSAKATLIHDEFRKFFIMAEKQFKLDNPQVTRVLEMRAMERKNNKLPKSRQDEGADRIQDLQDRWANQ
jgi:hypothetical protein